MGRLRPHTSHQKRKNNKISGIRNKPFRNFFGNVHEGQGYADKRKRKIINQYRKIRKHILKEKKEAESKELHPPTTDVKKTIKERTTIEDEPQENETVNVKEKERHAGDTQKRTMTRFSKVEKEYKEQKMLKEKQAQEAQKIREERKLALEKYKSKKRIRHKKLNQKSKKGQPIMKYHVEHLLQKIKNERL